MVTLKTLFVITVSTSRFFFPGTPANVNMSQDAKPPAVRSLNLEIASNTAAPSGAKATVTVPEGLKRYPELNLDISQSVSKPGTADSSNAVLEEYWGSGREISAGQPKIIKPSDAAQVAFSQIIPDKSYAFWPPTNSKPLDDDIDITGAYTFKTNYCGSAQVTLSKDQAMLDPIDITSATHESDLTKPIVIKWRPVANAVGYILKAYGGDLSKTITWTSSSKPDIAAKIEYHPVSKNDLESYIDNGVIIPPYIVSCTIPAGVFKGYEGVMLVMTAIGKDVLISNDEAETWVVVRSTASVPLHSAAFRGLKPSAPKNADWADSE